MRFKKSPQLPGAGRTRAGHHHGSHTPTSPGAILLSKMACQPKHFGRQCIRRVRNNLHKLTKLKQIINPILFRIYNREAYKEKERRLKYLIRRFCDSSR